MPAAFSLDQFREQTDMLLALSECAAVAEGIHRGVQDALIVHGADAIQSGREVAAVIQAVAGSRDQLGRSADTLKARPRQGRRAKSTEAAGDTVKAEGSNLTAGPPEAASAGTATKAA